MVVGKVTMVKAEPAGKGPPRTRRRSERTRRRSEAGAERTRLLFGKTTMVKANPAMPVVMFVAMRPGPVNIVKVHLVFSSTQCC